VTAVVETAPASACAWCGRELGADAARAGGAASCPACGVETTDPWPSDTDLDAAYSSWYRPDSGRFSGPGDVVLGWSRRRLAHRLDEIAPAGPILDVGCGPGALLDALHGIGREATGLERTSNREDVLEVGIEDMTGDWAGIVFWHSLEHLRAPRAALESAASMLVPGGALVIATPNAGSLQAKAFGEKWFARDYPRHLVHIPRRSLIDSLKSLGLTPHHVSGWRGGQIVFGWLHGLVGAAPPHLSLYDAIRRPAAREQAISPGQRALALAQGAVLLPLAAVLSLVEVALGRGGTTYVEAARV
jgi:SAM-dependent methyltransferase